MGSHVDLKRAQVEKDGMLLGQAPDSDGQDYAKGMQMTLEAPELDKLGIQDPQVGKKYNVTGVMKVIGYNNGADGQQMIVQMTSLGLDKEEQRLDNMYGA